MLLRCSRMKEHSVSGYNLCMFSRILQVIDFLALAVAIIIAVGGDAPSFTGQTDRIRVYTREIEFDYPNWVWNAAWTKLEQGAVGAPFVFDRGTNQQIVFEYLHITQQLIQTDSAIEQVYADPKVKDKASATTLLRTQRDALTTQQNGLAPFAEATLQT